MCLYRVIDDHISYTVTEDKEPFQAKLLSFSWPSILIYAMVSILLLKNYCSACFTHHLGFGQYIPGVVATSIEQVFSMERMFTGNPACRAA